MFNDEQDASSVRDSLNGNSWPPNEKRKELSVDFIPVDSVQEFIDVKNRIVLNVLKSFTSNEMGKLLLYIVFPNQENLIPLNLSMTFPRGNHRLLNRRFQRVHERREGMMFLQDNALKLGMGKKLELYNRMICLGRRLRNHGFIGLKFRRM